MARQLWLLFLCFSALSLTMMSAAHACDSTVELGVVCVIDCAAGDATPRNDSDAAVSHHHGCGTAGAFVPAAAQSDPVTTSLATLCVPPADRLVSHHTEPALRPPAA